MEKSNVLTTLMVLVLVLVVFNFYGTYRVANALNKLASGAAIQVPSGDAGNNNAPSAPEYVKVEAGDNPVLGDKNAKVTIIEFSDYQCPFCRVFWKNTLPSIKEQYIKTGKANLVYRDFPLSFHPAAQVSAEAAHCAAEQNKYWEMHDKMFTEQDKQGQGTAQYGAEELKKWAGEIGLDTAKFNGCLDSNKYKKAVQDNFNAGVSAGVDGTPAFFVNGLKIVGAQPFEVFQQAIEAALKK